MLKKNHPNLSQIRSACSQSEHTLRDSAENQAVYALPKINVTGRNYVHNHARLSKVYLQKSNQGQHQALLKRAIPDLKDLIHQSNQERKQKLQPDLLDNKTILLFQQYVGSLAKESPFLNPILEKQTGGP